MPRPFALLLIPALALWLVSCSSVDPPIDDDEQNDGSTLRSRADSVDFYIGAAVGAAHLTNDAQYAPILSREFNMLTAENAMKFASIRPARTAFDFSAADDIVDFAEAHEMAVRGHTLVWHQQVPSWITNASWSREDLLAVLEQHIESVAGRYRGRVVAWDVVNEAVADDGSLRESIWLDVIGPEYISQAFRWAHEADPEASLFYNDYSAEGLGAKSDAVYELVEGLLEDGVPIHGVGLQMHVSTEFAPSAADVATNIERLGELGLEVHITEMDVRIPLPASDAELAQQADVYQTMLEVCLEAWNCTAFVLWGFTDRHSWIPGAFDGYGSGLIFDENYEEKFAYDALTRALAGEN